MKSDKKSAKVDLINILRFDSCTTDCIMLISARAFHGAVPAGQYLQLFLKNWKVVLTSRLIEFPRSIGAQKENKKRGLAGNEERRPPIRACPLQHLASRSAGAWILNTISEDSLWKTTDIGEVFIFSQLSFEKIHRNHDKLCENLKLWNSIR